MKNYPFSQKIKSASKWGREKKNPKIVKLLDPIVFALQRDESSTTKFISEC